MRFEALFRATRAVWTSFVRDRAIEVGGACASGLTAGHSTAQFASILNRSKRRRRPSS
jgi:hypothetical protein